MRPNTYRQQAHRFFPGPPGRSNLIASPRCRECLSKEQILVPHPPGFRVLTMIISIIVAITIPEN